MLNDCIVINSDQRLLCVTTSISPPNDPSKNRPAADRPTAAPWHTGMETRISVNAAHVAFPPTTCTWTTTNDDLRIRWSMTLAGRWQRPVLPSLSSLLISLFSRSSCRVCIALCGISDNWELSRRQGAQQSRTSTLPTQWRLHTAAFYDCLAHRMCLCQVALSCSHCNVINQILQIRHIGYRSAVALSSPMLQITADVPISNIIIGLALLTY